MGPQRFEIGQLNQDAGFDCDFCPQTAGFVITLADTDDTDCKRVCRRHLDWAVIEVGCLV